MAQKKRNPKKSIKKRAAKRPKETRRVQNPHDSFFRFVFSFIEYTRQFIKGFLPSDVVELIRLETLTHLKETYTDENLAQHMTDMLFEVSLHTQNDAGVTKKAEIYLLIDHKSHPETTILEQFLRYMNERWQFDRDNGVKPRVIIPVVFYHGKEGWHIERKFANTFEDVDPALHKYIPNFEYILVNVGTKSDDEITQLVESGALQSSLLALKYIFDAQLDRNQLVQIFTPLQKAKLPMERLRPLLEAILRYFSGTKNPVPDELLTESVRTVFAEEAEVMDTIFERLAERSHQEGRQKGHQEGWREAELIFQQERQEAEFIFQQKQEAFEREREAARQKTLTRNREIVLGIVNHSLKLDAAGQEKIVNQLEKIDDEDVLNKLINAALDASRGDFEFFMMLLEFESKQSS
ncbi:MAG: Rpn family recombination-promoting nuclease/putative transposase [Chloroflexota bacterium]